MPGKSKDNIVMENVWFFSFHKLMFNGLLPFIIRLRFDIYSLYIWLLLGMLNLFYKCVHALWMKIFSGNDGQIYFRNIISFGKLWDVWFRFDEILLGVLNVFLIKLFVFGRLLLLICAIWNWSNMMLLGMSNVYIVKLFLVNCNFIQECSCNIYIIS